MAGNNTKRDPLDGVMLKPTVETDPFATGKPVTAQQTAKLAEPGELPKPPPKTDYKGPKHYRVMRNTNSEDGRGNWKVQVRGQIVTLPAGKILKDSNYPIQSIVDQGVQLEEVTAAAASVST